MKIYSINAAYSKPQLRCVKYNSELYLQSNKTNNQISFQGGKGFKIASGILHGAAGAVVGAAFGGPIGAIVGATLMGGAGYAAESEDDKSSVGDANYEDKYV